jgi:hypothetical protein
MRIFIVLIVSMVFLIACQKDEDSGVIDFSKPVEVLNSIPGNKVELDTSQKVISYSEAGVNFITGHITDLAYFNRAATQIPAIQMDRKGILYCAWYSNGSSSPTNQHGEGGGSYATLAVSIDKGETWLENRLIIAPINIKDCIFDPGLWMDPMGNVHFIWNKALNWWDWKGGVWETIITYNNRWVINTGPKVLMEQGVMSNKPTVLEGLNKILYGNFMYNFDSNSQARTRAYASDFNTTGTEITFPVVFSEVPILPKNLKTYYSEPQFLQVGDSISCYIREENSGIYFSKASLKDNLKNWKLFKPLTTIGDNPPVRFYIGRLMSGKVLLVTCNAKGRQNMTAYLSTDDGATFSKKLLIDPRTSVSYPDVSQGDDGTIYLVYDRERNGAKEIVFAKFKENDIINNQKVSVKKINSF